MNIYTCMSFIVGGLEKEEVASSPDDKKSKKNRCHTCKKKVGLTGTNILKHYL